MYSSKKCHKAWQILIADATLPFPYFPLAGCNTVKWCVSFRYSQSSDGRRSDTHLQHKRSLSPAPYPCLDTIIMSLLRSIPRTANLALAGRRAASTSAPLTVTSSRSNASAPVLANIEASWKGLPAEEQYEVYQQLEEIQKRDWKELTIDEKKAGESISVFWAWGSCGYGCGRHVRDDILVAESMSSLHSCLELAR